MSNADFQAATQIATYIRQKITTSPKIGIICGSGLGSIADAVLQQEVLAYKDIPGFSLATGKSLSFYMTNVLSSVVGHAGNLVFGTICDKPVVVMQGRFHQYEGYINRQIALPIRVMRLLGVEILFITNAAGGLNPKLSVGDFVVIADHISLSGLTGNNVLTGPNDERFGPRFPDTSDAYCPILLKLIHEVARDKSMSHRVHNGTYFHIGGPTYATDAETKMMIMLGGDVVGMSTVPEVHAARHCGMRVFAISLVTDLCNPSVKTSNVLTHEEVMKAATANANDLKVLLVGMIQRI
ncbi:purine-nucleoside phosphorylase [Paragonimus westermani]|uniref:Purine nucleoside phosphorylase n=1 Tax=Paragonimus westermani TaxID=34504 RepID=A0A5J4P072_9TREM|nr:purine-nucleoside phosphorylase [Paragonimus westermani]